MTFPRSSAQEVFILYDSDSLLNRVLLRKASGPQDCEWVRNILFVDLSAVTKLTAVNVTNDCYTDVLDHFKEKYGYFNTKKPNSMIPVHAKIKGFRELLKNEDLTREYLLSPLKASHAMDSTCAGIRKNFRKARNGLTWSGL